MPADTLIFVAAVIQQAAFTVCGRENLTPAGEVNTQWTLMLIYKPRL